MIRLFFGTGVALVGLAIQLALESASSVYNENTFSMNPSAEGIFPEPNKPPYFYAEAGGDWVKINEHWSIRFVEVISDDRCPFGSVCETSGKGIVKVQLMQPDVDYYKAYFETLMVHGLNRYPMPNGELKPTMLVPVTIENIHIISKKQIGFKITLADLRPYPEKKFVEDVKRIQYRGLFHIEELNQ